MSKIMVLELLPFFALITIAVIISSTVPGTAGFAFPNLLDKWSFGQPASIGPGSRTSVTNAYMPPGDLIAPAGFDRTFNDFDRFRSPMISAQKYSKTLMTPEGSQTRIVDQSFDGTTGQRTRTVTNL